MKNVSDRKENEISNEKTTKSKNKEEGKKEKMTQYNSYEIKRRLYINK